MSSELRGHARVPARAKDGFPSARTAQRCSGGGQRLLSPARGREDGGEVEQRVALGVQEVGRLRPAPPPRGPASRRAFGVPALGPHLCASCAPEHLRQHVVRRGRGLARSAEALGLVVLALRAAAPERGSRRSSRETRARPSPRASRSSRGACSPQPPDCPRASRRRTPPARCSRPRPSARARRSSACRPPAAPARARTRRSSPRAPPARRSRTRGSPDRRLPTRRNPLQRTIPSSTGSGPKIALIISQPMLSAFSAA